MCFFAFVIVFFRIKKIKRKGMLLHFLQAVKINFPVMPSSKEFQKLNCKTECKRTYSFLFDFFYSGKTNQLILYFFKA